MHHIGLHAQALQKHYYRWWVFAGGADLFVDFDRLFEVAGRCGKVCHLEQALVGLSRGLLALVVVCRRLKGLHRLRSHKHEGSKKAVQHDASCCGASSCTQG